MKKFSGLFLALLLLDSVFMFFPKHTFAAPVTINVYNWGQYISDGTDGYIDVIAEFEKAYPDIRVNYMVYDSNETMYTKLQSGGNAFDVIVPSDYMIDKLIAEDALEPLDFSNIPNYRYLDDAYKNLAYDPENKYSVPYTWGYVGIIYNTKYVNEDDVGSWDLLWNRNYAGKIPDEIMPNIYPHTFYTTSGELWDFSRFQADVVCVNLGCNDTSVGKYDKERLTEAFKAFTITLRERYPHAKIVYIIGAIRSSKRLTDIQEAHDAAIADAASRSDHEVYRMDFTPDDGSLGSGAVGHPSMRRHALMAEELTAFLRGITGWE